MPALDIDAVDAIMPRYVTHALPLMPRYAADYLHCRYFR